MTRAGFLRALLVAALASFTPAFGASAGAWNIEALMHLLARQTSGAATFVEHKHLAILDAPVESSGELRYRAPDRLEKITRAPRPESLVLEGDVLTVERDGRKHTVRLGDYPEVAAFIDSIRGTLAGDRAALERTYALDLAGSRDAWTLTLLPRAPKMAEIVLRITIAGRGEQLRRIEILQADGDRSVMDIVAMDGR